MSGVDLLDMYSRASEEAFRLETQQRYAVPAEDEQFRAFTEGRPMPSDPRVDRSMQIIRAAAARGCRIRRVHVVDLPLTGHLRYELAAYRENINAGEEVGIAVRRWHPDLAELTEDFVLFNPSSAHAAGGVDAVRRPGPARRARLQRQARGPCRAAGYRGLAPAMRCRCASS